MIGDPDVIIFDEPTNGLDPQGIAEVRQTLTKIADSGKTVIMASHILDEVEKICSHVAIIKNGHLLATGSVGSILSDDITVELQSEDMASLHSFVQTVPWISKSKQVDDRIEALMENTHSVAEINKLAFDKGVILTHLVARKQRLEEEFLEITK